MRALALLAALLASPAFAGPLDMSTQTCQDWLDASEDEQDQMVAWLRGYLAGHSTSTLYNLAGAREDAAALKRYCQTHAAQGVVNAAGQWRR